MKIFKEESKIKKSQKIIAREKKKIKKEKQRIKTKKEKDFYNTKLGKVAKAFFMIDDENKNKISIKKQILSMIYFEIIGFILCLLLLFILSGGKNYLKLYTELNKLINVYDTITKNYYGELNKKDLVDKAIDTMVNETGDKYTTYTNKNDTKEFMENVNGTYEGIGCTVGMDEDNNIYIVSIFKNTPAEKAGRREKDIILYVDGENYKDKTSTDMSTYIKNNNNKTINLKIKRDNEELDVTLIREKVEIPSVNSEIIEENGKKIGYIDISIFSSVTTKQFKSELKKLENQNIQGLIIDVRNNNGGYLSTATEISSMFLKKGSVIYQLKNNKTTEKIKDKTKEHREYPIAVLINTASASASEILAAAIKESYGGYVVGVNSYGKGTVQKTKKLSDGSMIKYTVQKWLTPNGTWIHKKGVSPTNPVAIDSNSEIDNQLQTATNLLVENAQ